MAQDFFLRELSNLQSHLGNWFNWLQHCNINEVGVGGNSPTALTQVPPAAAVSAEREAWEGGGRGCWELGSQFLECLEEQGGF